jgi:hypothetical protein
VLRSRTPIQRRAGVDGPLDLRGQVALHLKEEVARFVQERTQVRTLHQRDHAGRLADVVPEVERCAVVAAHEGLLAAHVRGRDTQTVATQQLRRCHAGAFGLRGVEV